MSSLIKSNGTSQRIRYVSFSKTNGKGRARAIDEPIRARRRIATRARIPFSFISYSNSSSILFRAVTPHSYDIRMEDYRYAESSAQRHSTTLSSASTRVFRERNPDDGVPMSALFSSAPRAEKRREILLPFRLYVLLNKSGFAVAPECARRVQLGGAASGCLKSNRGPRKRSKQSAINSISPAIGPPSRRRSRQRVSSNMQSRRTSSVTAFKETSSPIPLLYLPHPHPLGLYRALSRENERRARAKTIRARCTLMIYTERKNPIMKYFARR